MVKKGKFINKLIKNELATYNYKISNLCNLESILQILEYKAIK